MFGVIKIDEAAAAKAAPWAMMASNSYGDRFNFDLSDLGWKKVGLDGKPCNRSSYKGRITGLAYDIYVHDQGDVAMAFRGTNSKWDWFIANFAFPFSIHYWSAFKHLRIVKAQYGERLKTVTGHSLGGGIALGISARYGVDAVVFDPSPRIFDGLGDHHKLAKRWAIFQEGDPLQIARRCWAKYHEIMTPEDTCVCRYNFGGHSPHRMDLLAQGIVKEGAGVDAKLAKIAASIP
jgi:hypothetical protein